MGQAVRGADREGWMDEGGATDERNDSGRQRRGEGLTFPSLLYPSPATKAELLPPPPPPRTEGDEGEEKDRKNGRVEGDGRRAEGIR